LENNKKGEKPTILVLVLRENMKKIIQKVILIFAVILLMIFILSLFRKSDIKASMYSIFGSPEYIIIENEYYFQNIGKSKYDPNDAKEFLGYAFYNNSILGKLLAKKVHSIDEDNVVLFDLNVIYEKHEKIETNIEKYDEMYVVSKTSGGVLKSIPISNIVNIHLDLVNYNLKFEKSFEDGNRYFYIYGCEGNDEDCEFVSYVYVSDGGIYYGNLDNEISSEKAEELIETMVRIIASGYK